ncbi:MAG: phosphomannomutase [Micavibrio sp.]|nr:phosphomannomutase [Micavibrio sp.]|tara:strand:- start:1328 stop:2749 length:1422 start_codon:yes stop_codon:yes gene_type:complete
MSSPAITPEKTPYIFDPTILREYDIRGQIDKNLSPQDALALGKAFGTFVRRETGGNIICVGFDGRHSSPGLCEALIKGLKAAGIAVKNTGLGPTPQLYFAVKHLKADAGIMITGSHNPPDYNGFKMCLQNAPVFGQTIQQIGHIAAEGNFETGEGSEDTADICNAYIHRLMEDLQTTHKFKIAWDNGNGAAGNALRMLAAKLPGEHILLYDEVDGDFPNHHPDPTVDKNLSDLIQLVHREQCDFGIAFDGDGDRIGVVDDKGNVLRCDILMTLYARGVLEKHPGAPIIGDIKCSSVMFEEIERMGGTPVIWKTGHSLIKDKMHALNSPLAGELSGHIFFADHYYGYDDALYCAVRLINEVAHNGKPLSELTAHINNLHSTPEVRFEVDEREKFDLVPRVYENLKNSTGYTDINDIDGVRVTTKDGWWLLRPSNTQNVLVARAESKTEEGLKRLTEMACSHVAKIGYTLDFTKP